MSLLHARSMLVAVTAGGGGLSDVIAYSDPVDCSKAIAVKVRVAYVKAGVDVTLGLVDASDSDNATIKGTYDPILSKRQSSSAEQTTHQLTATGRMLLAADLNGIIGLLRLSFIATGAGAVGDILVAEITIVEED